MNNIKSGAKLVEEEIAQDIQQNLESAKQELSKYGENLMRDMELRAFTDLYAIFVPTKNREESAKLARGSRDELWSKALKKAKGDTHKAFQIWAKLGT